jgi:thymidylate kinase
MLGNNKYVVIEGLDGCGKTTLIEGLNKRRADWQFFEEPINNGSARKVLMEGSADPLTLELLMAIERIAVYAEIKARDKSETWVSSRSVASSYGYTDLSNDDINSIIGLFKPEIDLAFILTMTPNEYIQRNKDKVKDRIEKRPVDRHMDTQQRMFDWLLRNNITTISIDAMLSKERVLEIVIDNIDKETKVDMHYDS